MSLTNDKVQAFPILEDLANNAGVPVHKALEGATVTGKNAIPGLVAKDPSGNFKYLEIDQFGQVKVTSQALDFACLSATAKVTGGTSEQEVLSIVLQQNTEYKDIGFICSNFRQSEFRIAWVEDVGVTDVETELATLLVGPGDYTKISDGMSCLDFTSGGTGVQELRVYGTNKDVASDLRATLTVKEIQ